MSAERLPWFRCMPARLLGALAGLQPDEGLIYVAILLRIYETGGPIADSPRTLARRTGLTERRAAAAIESLAEAGKITLMGDNRIDSASTHEELEWQRARSLDAAAAGRISGTERQKKKTRAKLAAANSPEKAQQNQREERTRAERALVDREEDIEEDTPSPARATPLSKNWTPDALDQAMAVAKGMPANAIPGEGDRFRAWNRERNFCSFDWRESWSKWCDRYRPDRPPPLSPRGAPSPATVAGFAGLIVREHAQSLTGAFDVEPPTVDANSSDAEPSRGQDRGIAWQAGSGGRPTHALLGAAGFGGHDSRTSSALRRRKAG